MGGRGMESHTAKVKKYQARAEQIRRISVDVRVIPPANTFWMLPPITHKWPRLPEGHEMYDKADLAKRYRRRAEEVRTIAQGLYDEAERNKLMQFVDDYEQWATVMETTGRLNPRHLTLLISN